MKVKKTFWIFLVLLTLLFLIGKRYEYQIINKVVYAILILIGLSAIWTRISLNGLVFLRKARSLRKETGQVFEERFRLENKSKLIKAWVEIIDQSKLPGQNGSRIMAWIGRGELRNYSTYTLLTQRGKYNLFPTQIKSGDPFGLFEKSIAFVENNSLIVLPVSYRIHHFPLPVGYLPGGKSIRKRTAAITPYAAGIREYLPGDSMNRIHWKKTAQRGELITKEFEEDPQSDIWIILDSQTHSHSRMVEEVNTSQNTALWNVHQKADYQLSRDTYEYSVSIAATIADHFIRIDQGVGFHSFGKQSLLISPEKGYRQLEKIMESLAFVKDDGEQSLEAGITGYIRQIMPGSLVIIIATRLTEGLEKTAEYFKLRKVSPFYILLENGSFDPEIKLENNVLGKFQKIGIAFKQISYGDSIPFVLEK